MPTSVLRLSLPDRGSPTVSTSDRAAGPFGATPPVQRPTMAPCATPRWSERVSRPRRSRVHPGIAETRGCNHADGSNPVVSIGAHRHHHSGVVPTVNRAGKSVKHRIDHVIAMTVYARRSGQARCHRDARRLARSRCAHSVVTVTREAQFLVDLTAPIDHALLFCRGPRTTTCELLCSASLPSSREKGLTGNWGSYPGRRFTHFSPARRV